MTALAHHGHPAGSLGVDMSTTSNLLFSKTVLEVVDKTTGEDIVKHVGITLSVHARAAADAGEKCVASLYCLCAVCSHQSVYSSITFFMYAATWAVAGDVVRLLVNTRAAKPNLGDVAKHVAEAAASTFATSVLADKLHDAGFGAGSQHIALGAVRATFALIHGNSEAAAKAAVQGVANAALNKLGTEFMGMPLSIGSSITVANGGMLGGRHIERSLVENEVELNIAPLPGVQVGLHFGRESTVYHKRGRRIHKEAHQVGLHAGAGGVASLSTGLQHGYERADPITFEEGPLTVTETWERSFSGQLNFRANVGDRMLSLNILPAWKSRVVTWRFEVRTDGQPHSAQYSDGNGRLISTWMPANEGVAESAAAASSSSSETVAHTYATEAEARDAAALGLMSHNAVPASAASVSGGRATVGDRRLAAMKAHVPSTRLVDTKSTKRDVRRKRWGLSKRTANSEYDEGRLIEVDVTSKPVATHADGTETTAVKRTTTTKTFRDLRKTHHTKRRHFRSNKHWTNHYKIGEQRETTLAERRTQTLRVRRRPDGSALEERASKEARKLPSGEDVRWSRRENDFEEIQSQDDVTNYNSGRVTSSKTRREETLGTFLEEYTSETPIKTTSKDQIWAATKSRSGYKHGSFTDTRSPSSPSDTTTPKTRREAVHKEVDLTRTVHSKVDDSLIEPAAAMAKPKTAAAVTGKATLYPTAKIVDEEQVSDHLATTEAHKATTVVDKVGAFEIEQIVSKTNPTTASGDDARLRWHGQDGTAGRVVAQAKPGLLERIGLVKPTTEVRVTRTHSRLAMGTFTSRVGRASEVFSTREAMLAADGVKVAQELAAVDGIDVKLKHQRTEDRLTTVIEPSSAQESLSSSVRSDGQGGTIRTDEQRVVDVFVIPADDPAARDGNVTPDLRGGAASPHPTAAAAATTGTRKVYSSQVHSFKPTVTTSTAGRFQTSSTSEAVHEMNWKVEESTIQGGVGAPAAAAAASSTSCPNVKATTNVGDAAAPTFTNAVQKVLPVHQRVREKIVRTPAKGGSGLYSFFVEDREGTVTKETVGENGQVTHSETLDKPLGPCLSKAGERGLASLGSAAGLAIVQVLDGNAGKLTCNTAGEAAISAGESALQGAAGALSKVAGKLGQATGAALAASLAAEGLRASVPESELTLKRKENWTAGQHAQDRFKRRKASAANVIQNVGATLALAVENVASTQAGVAAAAVCAGAIAREHFVKDSERDNKRSSNQRLADTGMAIAQGLAPLTAYNPFAIGAGLQTVTSITQSWRAYQDPENLKVTTAAQFERDVVSAAAGGLGGAATSVASGWVFANALVSLAGVAETGMAVSCASILGPAIALPVAGYVCSQLGKRLYTKFKGDPDMQAERGRFDDEYRSLLVALDIPEDADYRKFKNLRDRARRGLIGRVCRSPTAVKEDTDLCAELLQQWERVAFLHNEALGIDPLWRRCSASHGGRSGDDDDDDDDDVPEGDEGLVAWINRQLQKYRASRAILQRILAVCAKLGLRTQALADGESDADGDDDDDDDDDDATGLD